jgi:hypothetical protein
VRVREKFFALCPLALLLFALLLFFPPLGGSIFFEKMALLLVIMLCIGTQYLRLTEKVGAKYSDRKSTVSAMGYRPNASPLQDFYSA